MVYVNLRFTIGIVNLQQLIGRNKITFTNFANVLKTKLLSEKFRRVLIV